MNEIKSIEDKADCHAQKIAHIYGMVCLVPRNKSGIASHERTLCDCRTITKIKESFMSGHKERDAELKDQSDSMIEYVRKVGVGSDEVKELKDVILEMSEYLESYDQMDLHDDGCIGAYSGREFQCNCNLRDVRGTLSKHSKLIERLKQERGE